MKPYRKVNDEISEAELEHVVRENSNLIEEGLTYVDHQKQAAGGRLDVLFVDSGSSFVVAELKVVQDDGMLMQGVDYCDYISRHIDTYARLYKDKGINPQKAIRLMLIAPSFSTRLLNRCKWINLPVSLVTYQCLRFEEKDVPNSIVPVFAEQSVPPPDVPPEITSIDEHLNYITDPAVRHVARDFVDDVSKWNPGSVTLDSIKYSISIKANGRLVAYVSSRRRFFLIDTFDDSEEWVQFKIEDRNGLNAACTTLKEVIARKMPA